MERELKPTGICICCWAAPFDVLFFSHRLDSVGTTLLEEHPVELPDLQLSCLVNQKLLRHTIALLVCVE
jgi:hypothetical protein